MEQYNFSVPEKCSALIDNLKLTIIISRVSDRQDALPSLHAHSYAELFLNNYFDITISAEKGDIVAKKGSGILVPHGFKHRKAKNYNLATGIAVGLSIERVPTPDVHDLYSFIEGFFEISEPKILYNCEQLLNIILKLYNCTNSVEKAILVVGFLQEFLTVNQSKNNLKKDKSENISGELQRAVKLEGIINLYFDRDLDADKLSELLFVSKRQLSRIVKKHYGTTLHNVITDRRINAAAILLSESHDSVEKIAASVGFSNKNSFYREFRNKYGVTPLEYRKSNKKQ